MNDDWRVQVLFREEQVADQWHDLGKARELERELGSTFQDRVIVSRDDACVFIYTGDRKQAERARARVESEAQENGWDLESDLTHWNHETLEWEPRGNVVEEATPVETVSEAPPAGEPEALSAPPEATEAPGHPDFEVRANLPSRQDASHLADRLRAEGTPCVRRWRHVVAGAADEEAAQELAERIRMEAPIGSEVKLERA